MCQRQQEQHLFFLVPPYFHLLSTPCPLPLVSTAALNCGNQAFGHSRSLQTPRYRPASMWNSRATTTVRETCIYDAFFCAVFVSTSYWRCVPVRYYKSTHTRCTKNDNIHPGFQHRWSAQSNMLYPPLPAHARHQDRSGDIHYLEFLAATIEAVGGMEVGVWRLVVSGREQGYFVFATRQVFWIGRDRNACRPVRRAP